MVEAANDFGSLAEGVVANAAETVGGAHSSGSSSSLWCHSNKGVRFLTERYIPLVSGN